MEIPGLFFLQRPSGPAGGWALLRLRDGRRVAGREKGEFGLSEALNSSPPSAARHPLNQQRVWAVIYASRSGDGARFFKKPKACSGGFSQGDIFRRQAPQARGALEPKRAARPWAARSRRPRRAALGAPPGDTWEQTRRRACPGDEPWARWLQNPRWFAAAASTSHALGPPCPGIGFLRED